jgi:hypothetical protein
VFGGTTAEYWDWRAGTFVPGAPPSLRALRGQVHVTLADWAALVRATGAEPVFDLNLFTDSLANQLAMLRAAARLGMPVLRVELGNELYAPPFRRRFADGAAYGRVASTWAAAIKRAFPGVQVAAVAAPGADPNLPAADARGWNAGLARTLRGVDALTVHTYFASGLPPGRAPARGAPAASMLSAVGARWQAARSEIDASPLPVWVTEWNLFDRTAAVHATWAQGLAVAAYGIDLLADGRVAQSDNHALVGSAPFGALFAGTDGLSFGRDAGFAAVARRPPATPPYGRSANGVAMAALLTTLARGRMLWPLAFTGGQGMVVTGEARARGLLVNLAAGAVRVTLPAAVRGGTAVQLWAEPSRLVTGARSLHSRAGHVQSTVLLEPYSLTLLRGR